MISSYVPAIHGGALSAPNSQLASKAAVVMVSLDTFIMGWDEQTVWCSNFRPGVAAIL
jgi:hypothetical protein